MCVRQAGAGRRGRFGNLSWAKCVPEGVEGLPWALPGGVWMGGWMGMWWKCSNKDAPQWENNLPDPPTPTTTSISSHASNPPATGMDAASAFFLGLHGPQLESLGFPSALYGRLEAKLSRETFDAGATFGVVEDEAGQRHVVCTASDGVAKEHDVYLIDHAYSFRVETYRQELIAQPQLLARLAAIMGLGEEEEEEEEEEKGEGEQEQDNDDTNSAYDEAALRWRKPDRKEKPGVYEQVCEQIWRFAASYRLVDPRDTFKFKTVWFVNDEFGSAFQHAAPGHCNFRVSPFIYLAGAGGLRGAVAFSIAWPVARIEEGEECTRDYAFGCPVEEDGEDALQMQRACRLATWFEMPPSVLAQFQLAHARKHQLLDMLTEEAATSTNSSSSTSSPALLTLDEHFSRTLKHTHPVIKVFTDNGQIVRALTRPEFTHVATAAEADVLWIYHSPITPTFREEHGLAKDVVLSQTEGDECLVFKHLLPLTAARCPGYQAWLPLTYDMEKEAAAFIHEYLHRQTHTHPPLFILKPWNLGRSLDSAVADSLPQALRLAETCPKVASEYVADIATVDNRKFDVRYRLMVRSWEPLELFRWVHWGLRVSPHAYSLAPEDINDFEVCGWEWVWVGGWALLTIDKHHHVSVNGRPFLTIDIHNHTQAHFTVMDYAGYVQRDVKEDDFLASFERDNGVPWSVVDAKVDGIIKDLFVAAAPLLLEKAGKEEARHMCSFYGVDIMVTKDLQPKLLECTFGPDCAAAVKQDPDFYNKAFGVLFLGEDCADFRRL